jgi:hypothetical protein
MHSNQQNLLSAYDGGTGTVSHLENGVERARQSRCKRLLQTQPHHSFGHNATYARATTGTEKNFILEYVILENSRRVNNRVNNPIRLRHFDDGSGRGNVNIGRRASTLLSTLRVHGDLAIRPGSFSSRPRDVSPLTYYQYTGQLPSHHSTTMTPNHELFTRTGGASDHSDVLPVDGLGVGN